MAPRTVEERVSLSRRMRGAASARGAELVTRRARWCKDLRRRVNFGRNDLVQDAPISRIDLLVCRNTLVYSNQETQTKILSRFLFARNPRGALFLGKAEMLLSPGRRFDPIDLARR